VQINYTHTKEGGKIAWKNFSTRQQNNDFHLNSKTGATKKKRENQPQKLIEKR